MIKHGFFVKQTVCSIFLSVFLLSFIFGAEKGYYRIVVLSDLHLPVKTSKIPDGDKRNRIIAIKQQDADIVNSWSDTDRIVITGDLAGVSGTESEFLYVRNYLKKFIFPVSVITGNHDFMYADTRGTSGKIAEGTPESKKEKLARCLSYYQMPGLCYTETADGYLLVFLSADSTDGKFSVELSDSNLAAFQKTLADHRNMPVIVFFHAPLAGTLLEKGKPAKGNYVAQPRKKIDAILNANPQVFMWISGHTHTPPSDKNFMTGYNLYEGRITDIFNTDLDREKTWSNSLYLYPDRVEVKTFSFQEGKWLPRFDRTVKVPDCQKGNGK